MDEPTDDVRRFDAGQLHPDCARSRAYLLRDELASTGTTTGRCWSVSACAQLRLHALKGVAGALDEQPFHL